MIKKIKRFIELSKWFHRKSQHYIFGNWTHYMSWFDDFKELRDYFLYWPVAYCKFMWLSRNDV